MDGLNVHCFGKLCIPLSFRQQMVIKAGCTAFSNHSEKPDSWCTQTCPCIPELSRHYLNRKWCNPLRVLQIVKVRLMHTPHSAPDSDEWFAEVEPSTTNFISQCASTLRKGMPYVCGVLINPCVFLVGHGFSPGPRRYLCGYSYSLRRYREPGAMRCCCCTTDRVNAQVVAAIVPLF